MFNKTLFASLFIAFVVIVTLTEAHPGSRHNNRQCSRKSGHKSSSKDLIFVQDRTSELDSDSDELLLQQFGVGPVINSGALRTRRVHESPEYIDNDSSDNLSEHLDVSDEDWALKNTKSHRRSCRRGRH